MTFWTVSETCFQSLLKCVEPHFKVCINKQSESLSTKKATVSHFFKKMTVQYNRSVYFCLIPFFFFKPEMKIKRLVN